jgi:hypothetical protein
MAKRRLAFFVAIVLLGGVILGQILPSASPPLPIPIASRTPASSASKAPLDRIAWNGGNWYLQGVNVPWYNWGCDFGCNATNGRTGGVSTHLPTLSAAFAQVQEAGIHVVRWWVFPGDPAQIMRDAAGVPVGIDPAVYADFDAALQRRAIRSVL